MQGVLAVGHLQGMGDGRKHGGHHIQRDIVVHLVDDLRERLALDVFHDHVGAAAFHGAVVHGDDIRIGQLRDGASLLQAGDVLEQIQLVFGVGSGSSAMTREARTPRRWRTSTDSASGVAPVASGASSTTVCGS